MPWQDSPGSIPGVLRPLVWCRRWGAFIARHVQAVPGPQTLLLAAALNIALEKAGLPRASFATPHNLWLSAKAQHPMKVCSP